MTNQSRTKKNSFKRSFSSPSLLQNSRDETIFSYVQCDFSVPDELKAKIVQTSPNCQIFDVYKNNNVIYMKVYAETIHLFKQPQ